MVEMNLTDAKTKEEVMAAVSENFPDKIEFEPGKFARFDPESGEWVYVAPDGTKVMITI